MDIIDDSSFKGKYFSVGSSLLFTLLPDSETGKLKNLTKIITKTFQNFDMYRVD